MSGHGQGTQIQTLSNIMFWEDFYSNRTELVKNRSVFLNVLVEMSAGYSKAGEFVL